MQTHGRDVPGTCRHPRPNQSLRAACAALVLIPAIVSMDVSATVVAEWDFAGGTHGWHGNEYVKETRTADEGLLVVAEGNDPWIEGPAVELPQGSTVRVTIRMKSNADRGGELFYVQRGTVHLDEIGEDMGPGDIFGEIGVFSPERARTSTARCKTDVDVFCLDAEKAKQVYVEAPHFALRIATLLAQRLVAERANP